MALRRDLNNRVLGGVCSGLARHMDLDPTVIRLAFLLAAVFWGVGPLIYLIMWLVIPAE